MSDLMIQKSEADFAANWWAVYTRHQHEKTVADGLGGKGLEVFLPLYESVRRWKDRNKILSLPLFPGYVFVRGSQEMRTKILTTPGIHMILYVGDRIATISETEIDAIRRSLNGNLLIEPHPYLRCGERVRVRRGSLEGVEGILTRKKSVTRLVLMVEMLQQAVAVEIDAQDVEPVQPNGRPASEAPALRTWSGQPRESEMVQAR